MFNVGDAVYHPANGVGIVARLQRMSALLGAQRCYRIRLLAPSETILLIPVKKAEALGLRPAAPAHQVEMLLQVIASEPAELPDKHSQRYNVCQAKLDAADSVKTAEVVRDLSWRLTQRHSLNGPDRRIFKKALMLLGGELALAQRVSLPEAEAQINSALAQQPAAT